MLVWNADDGRGTGDGVLVIAEVGVLVIAEVGVLVIAEVGVLVMGYW